MQKGAIPSLCFPNFFAQFLACQHSPESIGNVLQGAVVQLLVACGRAIGQEQDTEITAECDSGGCFTAQIGHDAGNDDGVDMKKKLNKKYCKSETQFKI